MNKLEKYKKQLIKDEKLDTVDKTIGLIEKYISKMNLNQLKITRNFIKAKQMKEGVNEGNAIFLKLIDERITEIEHGKK
jgi:hypothetical protein